MHKVLGIIVTFNPNTWVLNTLLQKLSPQVDAALVVDNGSSDDTVEKIRQILPDNAQLLEKGYNSGISEAINSALHEANILHFSHTIFFDQDSIPAEDMIKQLLDAIKQKNNEGIKVAAVGAYFSDIKGNQISPFVKLTGLKFQRVSCEDSEIVEVDHLITSGCLIPVDVLKDVGGMEQQLFIDYVDTEWCLRAINKGYSLYGVGAAKMRHDLGDYFVTLFGRSIPVHNPLRNYYLLRNGVWLLFQPWIPLNWRIIHFIRLVKIYVVFSLLAGKRFQNWKMMNKGLFHAIMGKMGKYPD